MMRKLSGVTAGFALALSATAMAPMAEAKANVAENAKTAKTDANADKMADLIFVGPVDEGFDLAALPPMKSGRDVGQADSSTGPRGMTRDEAAALAKARADRAFWTRAAAFQVLNAVDAAQTIRFLDKGTAYEVNPILGKHPSAKTIIGFKTAAGGANILVAMAMREWGGEDMAEAFQLVSVVGQGLVVGWNMQFM